MQEVVGSESAASRHRIFLVIYCCLLLSFICVGCGGSKSVQQAPPSELTASPEVRQEPLPVVESHSLDPFDVPKLADLDKEANWIDRPVRDGLVLLRESQSKEKVLGSVESALAISNNSTESNDLILSALGRLPAEDEADYSARIDRHVNGDLGSTNPIMISTSAEFDILGLTGFGLFSFGRDLEPFATSETVETWQTSTTECLIRLFFVTIWSGVMQADYAHDIAFTLVIMDPRVPVPAVRSGTDQLRGSNRMMTKHLCSFIKRRCNERPEINFPVLPKHIYEKTWEADPT